MPKNLKNRLKPILALLAMTAVGAMAQTSIETRLADGNPSNNEMKLDFRIYNRGTQEVVLQNVSLEYDFTDQHPLAAFSSDVWWYSQGQQNQVQVSVASGSNQSKILRLNFLSGKIPAQGFAEIQMRLYTSNWDNFDETDDPSFLNTSVFTENSMVRLVNGVIPSSIAMSSSVAPTSSSMALAPIISGNHAILAANSIYLADRTTASVSIQGGIAANGSMEVGADATISGSAMAGSNLFLRERAFLGGFAKYGAQFTQQNGVIITNGIIHEAFAEELPTVPAVVAGSVALLFEPNQGRIALAPGVYGALTLRNGNQLVLSSGEYRFESIWTEPDCELIIDNREGLVQVNVKGAVRFGDRNNMSFLGNVNALDFQLAQSDASRLDFGTDGNYWGRFIAPQSDVRIPSRVGLRGWIAAKSAQVEPDTRLCTPPLFEDLTHSEGAYGPEFNAFTPSYFAVVPTETAELIVTPYAEKGVTVSVNGSVATTPVRIASGVTNIEMKVFDAAKESFLSGCGTSAYRLKVTSSNDYMIKAYAISSCQGGACDGSSWASGYKSISEAYQAARASGKEIWIATGSYSVSGNGQHITSGTEIFGGFAGQDSETKIARKATAYDVEITGDAAGDDPAVPTPGSGNALNNAKHVFLAEGRMINLNGITIRNGMATGTGDESVGGGIYLKEGSLFLSQSRLINNGSFAGGAGVAALGRIELSQVEVSGNLAVHGNGAGISVSDSSVSLDQVVMYGNNAQDGEGAGLFATSSTVRIMATLFANNQASITGGAMMLQNCILDSRNTTIHGNYPNGLVVGAGVSGKASNMIFSANQGVDVVGTGPTISNTLASTVLPGSSNIAGQPTYQGLSNLIGVDNRWGTFDDGLRIVYSTIGTENGNPALASSADLSDMDWNGKPSMGAYKPIPAPKAGEVFGRFDNAGTFVSVVGGIRIITGNPDANMVQTLALSEFYRIIQVGVEKHDRTNVGSFDAYLVALDQNGNALPGASELKVKLYKVGQKDGNYLFRSVTAPIGSSGYQGKPLLFTDNPSLQGERAEAYVLYATGAMKTVGYRVPKSQF